MGDWFNKENKHKMLDHISKYPEKRHTAEFLFRLADSYERIEAEKKEKEGGEK